MRSLCEQFLRNISAETVAVEGSRAYRWCTVEHRNKLQILSLEEDGWKAKPKRVIVPYLKRIRLVRYVPEYHDKSYSSWELVRTIG